MEKWLCWGSLGISGFLLLLFVLDIALSIPFGGIGVVINSIGIVGCVLVAYLAWDTFRETR